MKKVNSQQEPNGHNFIKGFWYALSFWSLTALPHNPKSRAHWDEILPGLILGGLPIESQFLGHGDHGNKIINQTSHKGKPLSLVVSAMEEWEIKGKGLGLKPVQPDFWKSKGVEHKHLVMTDFKADIPLSEINEAVDAIDQARKEGSAYIHCKAGRGRSYVVVFCYLIKHEGLDVNAALELLAKQRPQVSPSKSQFETIEAFRKTYCPQSKPLNADSEGYAPYRKDILSILKIPYVQGMVAGVASKLASPLGWTESFLAGLGTTWLSNRVQTQKQDYYQNQYLSTLKKAQDNVELSKTEMEAFNSGFEAKDWNGWAKSWTNLSNYKHYDTYAAGVVAGQEHNKPLKDVLNLRPKIS